jgi:hypothetical protein
VQSDRRFVDGEDQFRAKPLGLRRLHLSDSSRSALR